MSFFVALLSPAVPVERERPYGQEESNTRRESRRVR